MCSVKVVNDPRIRASGQKEMAAAVKDVIGRLIAALEPEDVVLGEETSKQLKKITSRLPRGRQRQCIRGRISPLAEKELAQCNRLLERLVL